jgi:hypothetical protein
MTRYSSENRNKNRCSKLSKGLKTQSIINYKESSYFIQNFNINTFNNKMDKADKIVLVRDLPQESFNTLKIEYAKDTNSYMKLNIIKDIVKRKRIYL